MSARDLELSGHEQHEEQLVLVPLLGLGRQSLSSAHVPTGPHPEGRLRRGRGLIWGQRCHSQRLRGLLRGCGDHGCMMQGSLW